MIHFYIVHLTPVHTPCLAEPKIPWDCFLLVSFDFFGFVQKFGKKFEFTTNAAFLRIWGRLDSLGASTEAHGSSRKLTEVPGASRKFTEVKVTRTEVARYPSRRLTEAHGSSRKFTEVHGSSRKLTEVRVAPGAPGGP